LRPGAPRSVIVRAFTLTSVHFNRRADSPRIPVSNKSR
jgi:hypothetical protein